MDEATFRGLEKQARPIGELIKGMEGNWRAGSDPAVASLRAAEVVIGIDPARRWHAVFFGRAAFREGRKDGVLVYLLDRDTTEIEMLCAALRVVKGSYYYPGRKGD